MKSPCKLLALALLINGIVSVSSVLADDSEQQTFLYGVYAGCMHVLDTDSRVAAAPQEKKQTLCGCEVNYVKINNIRTQEQMEAAQQEMGGAITACVQSSMASK